MKVLFRQKDLILTNINLTAVFTGGDTNKHQWADYSEPHFDSVLAQVLNLKDTLMIRRLKLKRRTQLSLIQNVCHIKLFLHFVFYTPKNSVKNESQSVNPILRLKRDPIGSEAYYNFNFLSRAEDLKTSWKVNRCPETEAWNQFHWFVFVSVCVHI